MKTMNAGKKQIHTDIKEWGELVKLYNTLMI